MVIKGRRREGAHGDLVVAWGPTPAVGEGVPLLAAVLPKIEHGHCLREWAEHHGCTRAQRKLVLSCHLSEWYVADLWCCTVGCEHRPCPCRSRQRVAL